MDIRAYIKQLDQQLKEYDSIYHAAAVRYGLSDTALWILYLVADAPEPCTQQDLCQQCSFPKQTINTAINNLIREGYLILEPLPGARNRKGIRLTEPGQQLVQRTVYRIQQAEETAYGRFSDQELENYLDLTRRLNAYLREAVQNQLTGGNL